MVVQKAIVYWHTETMNVEHFSMILDQILVKSSGINWIFHFFINFELLVLEAPMELDKKCGHFQNVLLEISRFPGSFVLQLPRSSEVPLLKVGRKLEFSKMASAPPYLI